MLCAELYTVVECSGFVYHYRNHEVWLVPPKFLPLGGRSEKKQILPGTGTPLAVLGSASRGQGSHFPQPHSSCKTWGMLFLSFLFQVSPGGPRNLGRSLEIM